MVIISCRFRAYSFSARNFFFFPFLLTRSREPPSSARRPLPGEGSGLPGTCGRSRGPCRAGRPCPHRSRHVSLSLGLCFPARAARRWSPCLGGERGERGASLRASARAPGGPCAAGSGAKPGSQTAEHGGAFRESGGKAMLFVHVANKYNLGENPALGRASKTSQPSSILVGGIPTRLRTTSVVRNGIIPQVL